jgi:hypothetical protein
MKIPEAVELPVHCLNCNYDTHRSRFWLAISSQLRCERCGYDLTAETLRLLSRGSDEPQPQAYVRPRAA